MRLLRSVGSLLLALCIPSACALAIDFDQFSRGTGPDGAGDAQTTDADTSPPLPADYCEDASFCDDFDRSPDDLVYPWGISGASAANVLSIEPTGGYRTDGGFLHVALPATDEGWGVLQRSLQDEPKLRMRFALRVFDVDRRRYIGLMIFGDTNRQSSILFLNIYKDSNRHRIQLVERLHQGGVPKAEYALSEGPMTKLGEWVPVEVTVDRTQSPPLMSFSLDGAVVVMDRPMKTGAEGSPTITGGCLYASAADAGPTAVDIDDVRVDLSR